MSGNKRAKDELIRRYGAECFIEKLHLRLNDTPERYTSKGQMKRMQQLTYHHIKMKSNGGKATVENGALLSAENHQWFHKQSKEAQEYMNNAFQAYKREADACGVTFVDELDLPFEVKPIELIIDERGRYCRAKEKQKLQEEIDEYYNH